MPIINLAVNGKQVLGDGTKIVCMNSDYTVHTFVQDCDVFEALPYKSLVVRYGRVYREVKMDWFAGEHTGRADLPAIPNQSSVSLGVVGRMTDDVNAEPTYASIAVRFDCIPSVLCGTVVLQRDPVYKELDALTNGEYNAADYDADGFYKVTVATPTQAEEERTVDFYVPDGDQTVNSSASNRLMRKVVIRKPLNLRPDNIRSGVSIGGVVGQYEPKLTSLDVFADGVINASEQGVDGFSSIRVSVSNSTIAKTMFVGDTFTYDYDFRVDPFFDNSGILEFAYDGDKATFRASQPGTCKVTLHNYNSEGMLVETKYYQVEVLAKNELTVTENGNYPVTGISVVKVETPTYETYDGAHGYAGSGANA